MKYQRCAVKKGSSQWRKVNITTLFITDRHTHTHYFPSTQPLKHFAFSKYQNLDLNFFHVVLIFV